MLLVVLVILQNYIIEATNNCSKILCTDPNKKMIKEGKKKLKNLIILIGKFVLQKTFSSK